MIGNDYPCAKINVSVSIFWFGRDNIRLQKQINKLIQTPISKSKPKKRFVDKERHSNNQRREGGN